MFYAWQENGNVFVTPDFNIAPPNAIEVPDGTTPQDLVVDNEQLRLKTEQEKLEELKQTKLQEIACERWKEETGGLTLNGVDIATDRESQALLAGAVLKAQADPNYVVNWKAKNGWFQIDAATLIAIADAVRAHVQACFDKEKQLTEQIDAAETVAELEAVVWE